jgi:hypothetical protein
MAWFDNKPWVKRSEIHLYLHAWVWVLPSPSFFFFEIRLKGGQRKEYFHLPRQAGISRNKSTAQNTPTLMRVRYKIHSLKKFICVILIFCSFLRMEYTISWTTQNPWASCDLWNFYVSMIIIKKFSKIILLAAAVPILGQWKSTGDPSIALERAQRTIIFIFKTLEVQHCKI